MGEWEGSLNKPLVTAIAPVCMHVCVCARMRVCVYACVCVQQQWLCEMCMAENCETDYDYVLYQGL